MTMPALPQPIAATHRPATARNAQFGTAPSGMAGERSAVHNGGSGSTHQAGSRGRGWIRGQHRPGPIRDINERRAELRARRNELQTQLAAAQNPARQEPSPALLDQLPVTPVDLASMPDEISRQLFEALRLEIRYDFTTRIAACQITLAGETIDAVARTSRETVPRPPQPPSQTERG
jgi:hypothetical protein